MGDFVYCFLKANVRRVLADAAPGVKVFFYLSKKIRSVEVVVMIRVLGERG